MMMWQVTRNGLPIGHMDDHGTTREGTVKAFSLQGLVQGLFLPDGYPNSVQDGYLTFQFFDSLQALCSYLRGVLSTQAILEGLGVGQETASSLAATTQWVYRDGAGMLGGLAFAWYGAGYFDANVKRWRLFADFAVDLALTLELASPLICVDSRTCFTASVCTANILKAMCGVAAGATRAVVTVHFAKIGNTADVQAKEGSQETAVNLIGMVTGLWLARFVDTHQELQWLAWVIFVVLTFVHLISNYFCVHSLQLNSINESRFNVLVTLYQEKRFDEMNVKTVNQMEPILSNGKYAVRIGCKPEEKTSLKQLEKNKICLLGKNKNSNKVVETLVRQDATNEDILSFIYDAVTNTKNGADFVSKLELHDWNIEQLSLIDFKYRLERTTKKTN